MIQTTTLTIPSMACRACIRHVARAPEGMIGVMHMEVSLQRRQVTVEHHSDWIPHREPGGRRVTPDIPRDQWGRIFILEGMTQAEPLHDNAQVPLAILVDNHRAFLRYLERRVGDRELAEDILQDAFTKVIARPDQAPSDEAVVPWFYRTLRNAAIDQFRRRGAASRAVEAFARELETQTAPDAEMEGEICACVMRLAGTLKPEYAEALRAVDVQGTGVKAFADRHGLSASNAGVRVFRARAALKKRVTESCGTCAEHGCRNCTCQTKC